MLQPLEADHPRDSDAGTNDSTNDTCTNPLYLRDLKCGAPDKLGNIVREIMWMGAQYAVYCSDKGIYVHFSDCPAIEKEQRERFSKICPELCELRYLTAQMRGWQPWSPRQPPQHSLYEHNMAQALMLMMESHEAPAKQIAEQALAMAVRRVTNDNTIRYVRACLIFGGLCVAIGALALWLLAGQADVAARWSPYVLGGMFGALGAIFSIVTRLEAFELKPCNESRMNYWMSATRVLIGVMSAVALLLFADTLMTDLLGKLTDGVKHVTEIGGNQLLWPAVAVLGFVGGFAERLIPNILRQTVSKLGLPTDSDGTPVQAVRSKETAAAPTKPPPAAPGQQPTPPDAQAKAQPA